MLNGGFSPNASILDMALNLARGPQTIDQFKASLMPSVPSPDKVALQQVMANRTQDLPPPPPSADLSGISSPQTMTTATEIPAAFNTVVATPPSADASTPISGRAMEGKSRSSIDDLISGLYGQQKQNDAKDSNLAWMQFFSKMGSNGGSSFLSNATAGASALSDTMMAQEAARRANNTALVGADIKSQEWNREQADKEAENASQAQLRTAQAKYYGREGDAKLRDVWIPDAHSGLLINKYTGEVKNPYAGTAPPLDEKGQPTSNVPDDYFGMLKPSEIVNYQNAVKKNQPKDLAAQQSTLSSLYQQKVAVDDLAKQVPVASSGDMHTLQDFVDRNKVPILSNPDRANATILQNYDSLTNVLGSIKGTFGGTGRVLQAEFTALQNELGAAKNASPEQKALVVGKIQKKLDNLIDNQVKYTNDVSSGMAYMPSRVYKSPMQKQLEGAMNKDSNRPSTDTPSIKEGATATNPQTGHKMIFTNGEWVGQ